MCTPMGVAGFWERINLGGNWEIKAYWVKEGKELGKAKEG